jgi:tetratricopeptide (TPR) repeat protein
MNDTEQSSKPVMGSGATLGSPGGAGPTAGVAGDRSLRVWMPLSAVFLCVAVLAVYLTTMGTTVPFWDAGEFIATAKILGIPHPPGTPLYVLLGRIACLVPLGTIAARVNALSAVAGTIAVLFTFLATVKLVRSMWTGERDAPPLLALVAGLVAAFTLAFSETFWINAIEAEVYAISSMVMAISIWAVLQWRELPDREQQVGWLLVIFFMLSLSIGVHLGTYLVLPGLVVLVALEWLHSPDHRRWFVIALAVGLVVIPIMAMLVAVGWLAQPGFEALMRLLVKAVPALGVIGITLLVAWKRPRVAGMLVLLFLVGVSVHFYLLIRAGVDPPPAINEADPSNWQALWDVLMRKQYPPSDIFERRGPLSFQFDRMYLYYLKQQFALLPGRVGIVLPLALGFLGAIAQVVWRRRDAAMMLTHFWVMCTLLVIYLNLSGTFNAETGLWERGEVRERDYFFVSSFQIFSMWIGIGLATISLELWRLARGGTARVLTVGGLIVALLAIGVPLGRGLAARHAAHDRTHDYVARDYGYNILNFLEPDALLFTNGDNDTFPLWYLQEVEDVRKDVRVICLSLLNTDWYIRQCRDLEPRVPMTITDELLDNMQVALDPRSQQLYVVDQRLRGAQAIIGPGTVKDVAVRDIVATNDFERPVYFAVTVPDRVGFDRQLSFEGMVFRILPEPPRRSINFDKAYQNAFENFSYRGLLTEDFERDPRVIVDDTGEYLIQNYVNMFTQLAYELHARRRSDEAEKMLTAARAINPGLVQLDLLEGLILEDTGRYDEAAALFEQIAVSGRAPLDGMFRLGLVQYRAGRLPEALAAMQEAERLAAGSFPEPTLWLSRIHWESGRPAEARLELSGWIAAHPEDQRVRRALEALSNGDDSELPDIEDDDSPR